MSDGTRTNITVDENVERLKRYAFLEQAGHATLAGWLPGVPEWDVKNEIGLHIWEDADSCERLRGRLRELRCHKPERGIPETLHLLARELDCAQATLELLSTVYLVVKRALLGGLPPAPGPDLPGLRPADDQGARRADRDLPSARWPGPRRP